MNKADEVTSAGVLAEAPSTSSLVQHIPAISGGRTESCPLNAVAANDVRVTVVVPMRNEAENVPLLLEQMAAAFQGLGAELLVVADSDETPSALVLSAGGSPLLVRVVHRPPGECRGGLSSAVMAGARHARGEWVLVMDGDLRHPPLDAARLYRMAVWQDSDIVIATRYAGTGSTRGSEGRGRSVVSAVATWLSRLVFPRCLATVSDPMSGMFTFRRSAVDLDVLQPAGSNLLLEILVRNPSARVSEVSYSVAPCTAGRSKASPREGLAFLGHVSRLRRDLLSRQIGTGPMTARARWRQLVRATTFGLVGASGMVVNTAVLAVAYHLLGLHVVLGAMVATQASTLWNFVLTDTVVYRGTKPGTRTGRGARFLVMNNLLLALRLPLLLALVALTVPVLVSNAITLVLLFAVRFLLSDRVIYAGDPAVGTTREPVRLLVDHPEVAVADTAPRGYLAYRYDIAGVVTIGSQIRLPELEFFRAQWVPDVDVDIAVRIGEVGRRAPRPRARMTQYVDGDDSRPVTVRYEEQLGGFGANFSVELGETITVTVGRLLARSPHVVYTNVIEALLRFVMVSRGRMLLHSATLTLNGAGVMLSALTDTGKTATVLRLLREHNGQFLSDDMTIVDAGGGAICFPKPLTISAHTLRAVKSEALTRGEWRRLQFQSRLHSRGGRSIAFLLSRFNLPIMGINALTQIMVPPPKYSADRLVACRIAPATTVKELFIIERGSPRLEALGLEDTLARMVTNTDDAYGFPPFKYFAPAITVGGLGYRELRAREREILSGFLSTVRTRVLASDSFAWADEIHRLLTTDGLTTDEPTTPFAPAGSGQWPTWKVAASPLMT